MSSNLEKARVTPEQLEKIRAIIEKAERKRNPIQIQEEEAKRFNDQYELMYKGFVEEGRMDLKDAFISAISAELTFYERIVHTRGLALDETIAKYS